MSKGNFLTSEDLEEDFVDASTVNDHIATETLDSGYEDMVDADSEESEDAQETDDVPDESEVTNSEEESGGEDVSDDAPPKKTGDKVKDGQNKAIWKARQAKREAEERSAKFEVQLAELRGRIEGMAQPEAAFEPEVPDIGPEPEFELSDIEDSIQKITDYRVRKREAHYITEQQKQMQAQRQAILDASVMEARKIYEDYDHVESAWVARAKLPENKHLQDLMNVQPNPAKFVYDNQKAFEKQSARVSPEVQAANDKIAELEKQIKEISGKKGKKPRTEARLGNARGAAGKPRKGETRFASQEDVFAAAFSKKK
jgi:hypothetical protein